MGKRSRSDWSLRPRAPIPYDLLESHAFMALSVPAMRAFLRLVIEHGRHAGRENGRLICTHKDFERYGVPTNLIARSIRELIAVRLIERTREGAAGNADKRQAAYYRITAFPACDRSGKDGTHDYEKITSHEQAKELVRAASAPVSRRDIANGRKASGASKP